VLISLHSTQWAGNLARSRLAGGFPSPFSLSLLKQAASARIDRTVMCAGCNWRERIDMKSRLIGVKESGSNYEA
jgi:hypothetical protein